MSIDNEPRATISKPGMRVDFYWLGDRFGHTVSIVHDNHSRVVWRSVHDGDCGPVFQELHEQTNPDGAKVLYLSGAGGGAHWSMSVAHDPKLMCFDVAARVTTPPTDRVIEYRSEFAGEKPPISWGQAIGTSEEVDATSCRFLPQTLPGDTLPTTHRWKYAAI